MKIAWSMLILLAAGITQTSIAYADFIGINIGNNGWLNKQPQSINSYDDSIDLVDNLDNNERSQSLVLILEHPISAVPNFRYQSYNLNNSELNRSGVNPGVNGSDGEAGNRLPSSFSLSQDDIVLYYELLNTSLNLDMGIDLKRLNGEVEFSGIDNAAVRLDETIPLLYLSAHYNLPYDGFYLGANFNNFSLGDSIVEDSTIKLGYQSDAGHGFEGGLKSFSYEFNDTDTNLEYDGLFLNGYIQF
ncbi:MAG: TIGR04219 family outer membrane beta-barrel protein [Gammaproteobacteria bacterium]|nr:TIGR04219 family outer membrane beta-barrel protein [Gammaproteobacteria bacterium]